MVDDSPGSDGALPSMVGHTFPSASASSGLTYGLWNISVPKGSTSAICGTCLEAIRPKEPRVRQGAAHSRVHHIGCTSTKCGPVSSVHGWTDLSFADQAKAQALFEVSAGANQSAVESILAAAGAGISDSMQVDEDASTNRLSNMNFWDSIPWEALHDTSDLCCACSITSKLRRVVMATGGHHRTELCPVT